MLKKVWKKSVLILLGLIFMQVAVFGSGTIHIEIDGTRQVIPSDKGAPYIDQGVTMVPLTFISETLGHQVGWTKSTQTVTIDGGKIILKIKDHNAYSNNQSIRLDTPPTIKNGRTYVPLRFIASELGAEVNYKNNTVMIGKSGDAGSGSAAPNSKNSSVNIEQVMKNSGYELNEYKTADVTKDGIKDYIVVGKKSWDGYLLIVDGVSGKIIASQEVLAGEYGCDLTVDLVGGNYQIIYTARESIPTQGLYEFIDGKLKNHSKILNEEFKIKFHLDKSMIVVYPESVYNQEFMVAQHRYNDLMTDTYWYPLTIGEIKNGKLEVSRDIIFPSIGNSAQFEMVEQYTWDGATWKISKVVYNNYDSDFKKADKQVSENQPQNILEWVAQGKVDTLPGKIGDPITEATKVLGKGEMYTQSGAMLHDYGNYGISESLQTSKTIGYTFTKGFELYGITIGDDAKTIESKLGQYHKKDILDDETILFLRSMDSVYSYDYEINGNKFSIYFDKNHRSLDADFYSSIS